MERDYKRFPRDENGDVLWRMFCHGDKLDKPRVVDFSIVFPTREGALAAGAFILELGHRVQFSAYKGNKDLPWQLAVTPTMALTHEEISAFEKMLQKGTEAWNGQNDGWGCFEIKGE